MKKLISLVLALVMVLAIAVASADGTIKISRDASYQGTGGRTYAAYLVFNADRSMTAAGTNTENNTATITYADEAISYYVANNSPWLTALAKSNQTWFDVKDAADGSKKVVTKKANVNNDVTTAKAIAAFFASELGSTGLSPTATITPGGDAVTVPDGYYLLVPSDGATNPTLVTTNVDIHEKNTYLGTKKTSPETNHYIGEKIPYEVLVIIPADTNPANPVIVHDIMDSRLKFSNDVVATIGDDENAAKADGATEFTAFTVATTGLTDTCTFEINIPVDANVLGKTILFKYTGEVTSDAATEEGLINTEFASHGDYKTTPWKVYDYTFHFPFKKIFEGTDEEYVAKFELRTDNSDKNTAISFLAKDANGFKKKTDSDDQGGSTELEIKNQEVLKLAGLKAGTYYLIETATHEGYNPLTDYIKVEIVDTTTDSEHPTRDVYYTIGANGTKTKLGEESTIEITNLKGAVLPSTGGIGTTIFYILGGLLVIGAAVILVARRKAHD